MKKVRRIIGKFVYLFAKHLPESYKINLGQKKIRAFCGKCLLEKCGKNINIEKNAEFAYSVEIGDNSGLGINCRISGKTIIGNNVMMGPNVSIFTKNHVYDRTDIPMNLQGMSVEKTVIIEDDVWIGANVTILNGIKISKGAIIGAGSVVTRNIPEYAIVGGNPAKILKYRSR